MADQGMDRYVNSGAGSSMTHSESNSNSIKIETDMVGVGMIDQFSAESIERYVRSVAGSRQRLIPNIALPSLPWARFPG